MNINVKIEAIDHEGRGIAHLDGKVCFIPNALPSEEIEIKIIANKKKYMVGEVIRFIKTSDLRIKPKCPYYEKCTGCSLEHLSYDEEINYKKDKVLNILNKYAKLNPDITIFKSDLEYNYRNKIELKIKDNKWGYYNNMSHNFISIHECILAKKAINKIIENKDLFQIKDGEIIIKVNYNGEILIKIMTDDKNWNIDIKSLRENNKIVGIIVNDKLIDGESDYIEIINNKIYKVNINSFFQINLNILEKIFNILNEKQYKTVVDLYCGVGTLGIALKKECLYGIEIVPEAIKNAIVNAKINKQDNYYLLGDASKIKEIDHEIDTIIVDPPRAGINKQSLDFIMESNIKEIIYMSCDPMTLARDLNILKTKYDIVNLYLFDMFPRTYHVECVCVLKLR